MQNLSPPPLLFQDLPNGVEYPVSAEHGALCRQRVEQFFNGYLILVKGSSNMEMMKAMVKTTKGVGFVEVKDVPKPEIKTEKDILIRVKQAGVCGTDIHIYNDMFPYNVPVILGHEFVGEIEAVGSAVKNLKPGDRVIAEPHTLACGTCEMCRSGHPHMCSTKRSPGYGIDGCAAEYICYSQPELVHKVPDNVPDSVAVLTEPMAVAMNGVIDRTKVELGDVVVISGAGPIGQLSAVCALEAGAYQVIMLGTDADEELRFPIARELGVTRTINVMKENAVDIINEMTDGRGVDVTMECSGAASAVNTAIDVTRVFGRIGVIAIPGPETIPVKWATSIHKCHRLEMCYSSSPISWVRVLHLMAATNRDLSCLATMRVPLADWAEVFDAIKAGKCIKGVLIP